MCHLVLLMPVIALPIFWLTPPGFAVPVYTIIVLISAGLYWLITRAMHQPVQDGFQSLIGTRVDVAAVLAPSQYQIRAHGELWSAFSKDSLQLGEQVNIVATRGIGVVVEKVKTRSHSDITETENG